MDEGFAKSYEVYQDILKAIRTGDTDTMNQILLIIIHSIPLWIKQ
nr:hypothetical protein [Companilactobacillus paralimentarius]